MKPKKQRYRLSNINVKRVGLVDSPAINEEFLIAKRDEGEEEEQMGDKNQQPTGQMPEPIHTDDPPSTPGPVTKAVTLTKSQSRTIYSACETIERSNFYEYPYEYSNTTEVPQMPDEVMVVVKQLRDLLGTRVAKNIQQDIAKAKAKVEKAMKEKIAALDQFLTTLEAEVSKVGQRLSKASRQALAGCMSKMKDGMQLLEDLIGSSEEEEEEETKKAHQAGIAALQKRAHALFDEVAKSIALTEEEQEDLEMEAVEARHTQLLVNRFKRMTLQQFQEHLEKCTEDERETIVAFLEEQTKQAA